MYVDDDDDDDDDDDEDDFLVKATFFKDETLGSLVDSSQLPTFWRRQVPSKCASVFTSTRLDHRKPDPNRLLL